MSVLSSCSYFDNASELLEISKELQGAAAILL